MNFERIVRRLPFRFQQAYWAQKLELDPNLQRFGRAQERRRYERRLLAEGCDARNAMNAAAAHVAYIDRTFGFPVYHQRERAPRGGVGWRALKWLLAFAANEALSRLLDLALKLLQAVQRQLGAAPPIFSRARMRTASQDRALCTIEVALDSAGLRGEPRFWRAAEASSRQPR